MQNLELKSEKCFESHYRCLDDFQAKALKVIYSMECSVPKFLRLKWIHLASFQNKHSFPEKQLQMMGNGLADIHCDFKYS